MDSKTNEKINNYLLQKSEKITFAILSILSYRTQKNVLKDKITKRSIDLFELLASVGQSGWRASRMSATAELSALEGLLDLAERLGFFPSGAAKIISIEFRELFAFLDEYGHFITGEPLHVDREMLKVELLGNGVSSGREKKSIEDIKDIEKDINMQTKKLSNGKNGHYKGQKENTRKMIILSEIEKKGKISIKDIQRSVPNCSGKTLQRELALMIGKGILKKEGTRRWTLYSLAD